MSKKKSKKSINKKVHQLNPGNKKGKLYKVADIERMADPVFLLKAGNEGKRYSVAAAYVSDVLDIARDNGVDLDLTTETEMEMFDQAISRLIPFKRAQGEGDDWAREQIEKSFAAYQLFLLCNFVNTVGKDAGLLGTIEMKRDDGLGLVVVATNEKSHKTAKFNPFVAIQEVSDECFEFGDEPGEFVATIEPFRQIVKDRFLTKIASITDDECVCEDGHLS